MKGLQRSMVLFGLLGIMIPHAALARNGDNKTPKSRFAYSFEAASFAGGSDGGNGWPEFMTNLSNQGYMVTRYNNATYDDDPEGCTISNLISAGHSGVLGVLYAHSNGTASDIEVYKTAAARNTAFDAYVAAGWNPGGVVEIRKDDTNPGGTDHFNVTLTDLGFANRLKPQTNSWDTIVILSGCCESIGLFDDIGGRVRFANDGCPSGAETPAAWAFNLTLLLERMSGFKNGGNKRPAGDAFNEGGFKTTFRMDGASEGKTTLCPAVMEHAPTGKVTAGIVAGHVLFDTEVSDVTAANEILTVSANATLNAANWTVAKRKIDFTIGGVDPNEVVTIQVKASNVISWGNITRLDGNGNPAGSDGVRPNNDDYGWKIIGQRAAVNKPEKENQPREAPSVEPVQTLLVSPNPFAGGTTVSFSLARPGHAQVHIYDATGALVETLVDEQLPEGLHAVAWSGRGRLGSRLPTGVYFVRVTVGVFETNRKVALIR